MSASVESLLGAFVSEMSTADIPDVATQAAGVQVLDSVGVALAGAVQPAGQVVASVISDQGGNPQAHVLGMPAATSAAQAAWGNGALIHLLDFDDTGFSHPSSCVLPAALAVAEYRGASGAEFLAAMVLGYEVFERLAASGRADEQLARRRGWHPTSIYGAVAASAAAGRLLGLDPDQQVVALGLAAADASGLTQQFGTWGKGLNAGNAARAGVTAALLAAAGYWGDAAGITGRYGLFNAVLGEGHYDFAGVEPDLGKRWSVVDPGIFLKVYPACGINRRAVDAVLGFTRAEGYSPDAVHRIVVHVHPNVFHTLRHRAPTCGFQGKFSLDYTVASAALDGALTIESFSDEMAKRPALRAMLAKVTLAEHPEWPMARWREIPVEMHLSDGRSFADSVLAVRGSRSNPLSTEELLGKYRDCAGRLLDADQVDASVAALLSLAGASDVRAVVATVIPARAG